MYPTLSLGSLVLPTAGLVYIIGAWLALSAVERAAGSLQIDAEGTYSIAATGLGVGLIGARLAFVATHWPAYRQNLSGIVWPLTSGFDLWAGLVIGIIAAFFYGRSRGAPAAKTLDALAPGLLTGFLVISLADFVGGPGYGTETSVPWGIDVFGISRHPVQVYELLFGIVAIVAWSRLAKRGIRPGGLFLATGAIYATGRLLVDAFRANAPLTAGGYHILQLASLGAVLLCVYLLGRVLAPES